MRWLDRLEDRLHWLAFPGLFKYLALTGVVVTVAYWLNPGIEEALRFDRDLILQGEVWRLFGFALAPTGLFGFGGLGVLFLYFATMIAFLVNDSLEEVWGPTRTTLYLLVTIIGLVIGQFILGKSFPSTGFYLYNAMFLAFATHFPTYEFRLFLILPVQVRWLAWLSLALMVYSVLALPIMILLVLPTLLPYAIWVLPDFIRNRKGLAQAAARRRKFASVSVSQGDAFHRCTVCKRTEKDDDELEFRTYPDGTEYCVDHLPEEGAS
ncbi:hypothetical protein [Haloferula rosea]|uniref:Rhomboid family intramembrane serine protease n=1 Tax=Haloferula rosea TaxID=490093 RepID=A0A934VHD1_9BACT|nr:hypothetical protein [Haloferula rosea]MBK1828947.1 hypothetical protein [Haloferula rosea]